MKKDKERDGFQERRSRGTDLDRERGTARDVDGPDLTAHSSGSQSRKVSHQDLRTVCRKVNASSNDLVIRQSPKLPWQVIVTIFFFFLSKGQKKEKMKRKKDGDKPMRGLLLRMLAAWMEGSSLYVALS